MKILVTGSSGTIGTRLCETLLKKGHEVVGVDWLPNKWNADVQKITIEVDMLDANALASIPKDIDIIVHLAANARVYDLVEDPDQARDNILTVYNALEFARKNSVKRFIFASSRETYGNIDAKICTEDMADFAECESPYTASKFAGEALVEAYKRCYALDAIILRFSNVYGMYDDSNRVVPLFFRQAKAGETLKIFGKDKCLDFTYIDDNIDGIILAIEKFDEAKNETYNLAIGEGTTILHLAKVIKELVSSTSNIEITESRIGEVTHYVADISKAKSALDYDPKIGFEEGIKKTIEWYEANA